MIRKDLTMSRRLHLLAVFALTVAPVLASSPRPEADDLATIVQGLEPAAVAGRVPDILAARLACLRLLSGSPAPDRVPLIRYTVAYAAWRVAFSPAVSAREQVSLLDDAAVQLEAAIKTDGRFAEAMGLLSAVDGAKIAHAPELGMTLGPESSAILGRGLGLDANNPRLLVFRGQAQFNTPPEFGGSIKDAEATLRRALQAFEQEPTTKPWPAWGRFDAHAWLGQALASRHDNAGARAEYEKALAIAPDSAWVKYSLLPQVKGPEW
jgi:tetratricopeptide (TPR) repeat protein